MKIYTKKGDKGKTSLFGGKKISKGDLQIEAYGTLDELNSFVGLLISHISEEKILTTLKKLQVLLFDLGSHLASDGTAEEYLPEINSAFVDTLEEEMDSMTAELEPLKSFIMPGGNQRISLAHVCRTVCRRAERRCVTLSEHVIIPELIVQILNRTSDYFFVLARYLCYLDNIDEVKWNPK